MSRIITSPGIDRKRGALPVALGGLGSNDPKDLSQGLNIVTESMKDVAGGVVPLTAQGKIPVSKLPSFGSMNIVSLSGTFEIFIGQSVQFQITDFSSFKTYDVNFSSGTWEVDEDTISYTAPATAQSVTMNVNGREITFDVALPQPVKPTITSPVNGAVNQTQTPTFVASAYAYNGGMVAHKDSTWQIATDLAFTNIVAQSVDDGINKTTWTPTTQLSANQVYHARVRYRDVNNLSGSYSNPVTFNTKISFVPMAEEAKLIAFDRAPNDHFAFFGDSQCVSIDNTGTRVAIGAEGCDYDGFTDQGAIYVFVRVGNAWSLEQKIIISDEVTNDGFGSAVKMDGSGTRIVAGAFGLTHSGSGNAGKAYVFTRTGATWTRERVIVGQTVSAGAYFGIAVAINKNGDRIAIGSSLRQVEIYRRSGTTWVFEQILQAADADGTNDSNFGGYGPTIELDQNADRIVIGAATGGQAGQPSIGCFYVFVRSNTTWTQETKVVGTIGTGQLFGYDVDIDDTGTRLIVAARNGDRAFIYVRSGVTWTLEHTFLPISGFPNFYFGFNVSINGNGDVAVVSDPETNSATGANDGAGYVAVFKRTGNVWDSGVRLLASDIATATGAGSGTTKMGHNIDLSGDGNRLIASGYQNISGVTSAGSAYIFA